MAELPSGTVTFLFTDIEGSTRLLKRSGGDRYAELLDEHQRILRAAFAAHGGQEVDTQGDSFFVAFRTAKDAVAAAVDAQRDLDAHAWPEGAQVKVRMGLHTGEPKVGGERYVGIGVHRAARIGAAGHGGQVLLSSTTKELAEEDLPPGVTIRDLGERRLKDLDQRQRLYQLVIEGLPSEFAPLRTLDVELKRKRRRMYAGAALIGVARRRGRNPRLRARPGQLAAAASTVAPNSVAVIDPELEPGRPGDDRGRRAASADRFRLRLALGRQPRRRDRLADRPEGTRAVERDAPRRATADRARGRLRAVWVVGVGRRRAPR